MVCDEQVALSCPDYNMGNIFCVPEDAMKNMMLEYQCSSLDSEIAFSGFSEIQMKALYNGTGNTQTQAFIGPYTNNTTDMGTGAVYDLSELKTEYVDSIELAGFPLYSPYESTGSTIDATSMLKYLTPKEEAVSTEPYMNMECQHAESSAFPVQAAKVEEAYGFHPFLSRETSTSNVPPRSLSRKYRQRSRAAAVEYNRRAVISEKIQALQELLPASLKTLHAQRGAQEAIVDNAIAHVKYLQLQLKELSRSKLGGESRSAPLSFLEGYGHYHPQEEITTDPLEEVIGNLMEDNQATALRLLGSKGLHMMPMTSIETLRCSE